MAQNSLWKAEVIFRHREPAELFCLKAEMEEPAFSTSYRKDEFFHVVEISIESTKMERSEFWETVCGLSNKLNFIRRQWVE